jgi:perosamine synthetase
LIPVNEPLLDGNEKKYLTECIETGWISSEGPFVSRFEKEFAQRVGRKHAIAVANGSLALDAAMVALNIEPGSEVIMPAFTIISCAAAIVRAGCVPVVVDADPLTWNMDALQIESRITPRTRAIMVVHIYGLPCDMRAILDIAQRHGLQVIEDAAEAHGQVCSGQACGSFGDLSIFSFYPNKHVTTGEGGMILTDSDQLAEKCRGLRNLCFVAERRFVHDELGWNMRMTNMQAALGVAQLERLDDFVGRKRNMGRLYSELLAEMPGIQLPLPSTEYAENVYWVFGIVLDESLGFDAKEAMYRLGQRGIGTRPFFWPMHEQPVFRKQGLFEGVHCPVSERLARRGFYVPSGLALSDDQISEVAAVVREVIR